MSTTKSLPARGVWVEIHSNVLAIPAEAVTPREGSVG